MRKILLVILLHIAGVTVLFWVGRKFNTAIADDYAGLVAVFSAALGLYTTAMNILYQKSPRFHLLVSRLFMRFQRTHTFWLPHFDFVLPSDSTDSGRVLNQVWGVFSEGKHGQTVELDRTPTTLVLSIDDFITLVFRHSNGALSAAFRHKIIVPSHLYDVYRQRLALFAEELMRVLHPTEMRCGIQISFADGVRNPYYGFFVNRIPRELLQDFQAVFQFNARSQCRIEAGRDHVNIESKTCADLFEAMNQVLNLRAVPV